MATSLDDVTFRKNENLHCLRREVLQSNEQKSIYQSLNTKSDRNVSRIRSSIRSCDSWVSTDYWRIAVRSPAGVKDLSLPSLSSRLWSPNGLLFSGYRMHGGRGVNLTTQITRYLDYEHVESCFRSPIGQTYLYSHAGTLERCCDNCNFCSTVAYRPSPGRGPTLTLIWSLITEALASEINMEPRVRRLHPADKGCARTG
jgi:hypothetical protein